MLDQKELTVGGTQFVIQQLPSSRGINVAITIVHIISGASEGIGFTPASDIMDTPVNPGGLVAGIMKRLDANSTPQFIKQLVLDSVIRPDLRKEDLYEAVFSGKYDDLFELVEQIIVYNNFHEVVKKRLGPLWEKLSTSAKSQESSIPSTSDPS